MPAELQLTSKGQYGLFPDDYEDDRLNSAEKQRPLDASGSDVCRSLPLGKHRGALIWPD